MSYQRFFTRPQVVLLTYALTYFPLTVAFGATAQSTASVSWASAFSVFPEASSIYNAGEDLLAPDQTASFSNNPTNSGAQGLNFGDLDTGASGLADANLLLAESHATDGTAMLSVTMFSVLYFEDMESGSLNITVPYTLSTLVQPYVGSSTVTVFASLDIIDFLGNTTSGVTPEPSASLDDSGLGSPNDLTGILSLEYDYNGNSDLAAILTISVITESTATPRTLKTVPIPGGIALAIPALLPWFASRKDRVKKTP